MSQPTAQTSSNVTPISARVLVIGAGGLGCAALSVLAKSGLVQFTIVDDDRVDASNLHRQVLYRDQDIGALKAEVAAQRVRALSPFAGEVKADAVIDRFLPDNARALLRDHDLVLEGADNFATKFLAADAAKIAGLPIVQAGAVRFSGWALASLPNEGACLRCFFEDIPRGQPETCAVAGVLGPVVSLMGAVQAALTIELLLGRARSASVLFSYEALLGKLRKRRIARRADCALCTGQIHDLNIERYAGDCAA